jgi:hypothetical protein
MRSLKEIYRFATNNGVDLTPKFVEMINALIGDNEVVAQLCCHCHECSVDNCADCFCSGDALALLKKILHDVCRLRDGREGMRNEVDRCQSLVRNIREMKDAAQRRFDQTEANLQNRIVELHKALALWESAKIK